MAQVGCPLLLVGLVQGLSGLAGVLVQRHPSQVAASQVVALCGCLAALAFLGPGELLKAAVELLDFRGWEIVFWLVSGPQHPLGQFYKAKAASFCPAGLSQRAATGCFWDQGILRAGKPAISVAYSQASALGRSSDSPTLPASSSPTTPSSTAVERW